MLVLQVGAAVLLLHSAASRRGPSAAVRDLQETRCGAWPELSSTTGDLEQQLSVVWVELEEITQQEKVLIVQIAGACTHVQSMLMHLCMACRCTFA